MKKPASYRIRSMQPILRDWEANKIGKLPKYGYCSKCGMMRMEDEVECTKCGCAEFVSQAPAEKLIGFPAKKN